MIFDSRTGTTNRASIFANNLYLRALTTLSRITHIRTHNLANTPCIPQRTRSRFQQKATLTTTRPKPPRQVYHLPSSPQTSMKLWFVGVAFLPFQYYGSTPGARMRLLWSESPGKILGLRSEERPTPTTVTSKLMLRQG